MSLRTSGGDIIRRQSPNTTNYPSITVPTPISGWHTTCIFKRRLVYNKTFNETKKFVYEKISTLIFGDLTVDRSIGATSPQFAESQRGRAGGLYHIGKGNRYDISQQPQLRSYVRTAKARRTEKRRSPQRDSGSSRNHSRRIPAGIRTERDFRQQPQYVLIRHRRLRESPTRIRLQQHHQQHRRRALRHTDDSQLCRQAETRNGCDDFPYLF